MRKTITVVEHACLGAREYECHSFECVCKRYVEGDRVSYEFFLYGWYDKGYSGLDKCIVGHFLDLRAAMDKLDELEARLKAAKPVVKGVTA